jgi:hypothetical protein
MASTLLFRRTALVLVALAAACEPSAQVKARLATLDTVSAQKDSLITALAMQTQTLSDVTAALAKVQVRNLHISSESPAAAQRDTVVQTIRYLVTRVSESESQLRASRRQITQLTHLSDSLRTTLETTLTNLQNTIDTQKAQIAALTGQVDSLNMANVALTDTLSNMSTRENTVYYVIGTREQLQQKGVIVQEGGARVLWVLWKTGATWQPARNLDPAAFTAIDRRQVTQIPLPYPSGSYRILSRQDPRYLGSHPDANGRLSGASLDISAPTEFWRNSRFLIILQEKPGQETPSTD